MPTLELINENRTPTRCDQCGQLDDHPKVHIATGTKHHDCLSFDEKQMEIDSGQRKGNAPVSKIIEACEGGLRGAKLLDKIEKLDASGKIASHILATSMANDLLDAMFPNAGSGSPVIGGTTYTLPFRAIFLSTVSTDAAQGTEWSTSGGYTNSSGGGATGGVPVNGLFTTAAASKSKSNTGAITVTNAPAGTWADVEIHDSTTTTQKRVAAKGTPSLAKTVNAGDTCTVPIGSLTGSFTA